MTKTTIEFSMVINDLRTSQENKKTIPFDLILDRSLFFL